jgi:cystathionine beta-lyase
VAFSAAYGADCDAWKDELLGYLKENRDYFDMRMAQIPRLQANHNEGTFLAWIDCTQLGVDDPAAFLEERAGVRLGSGGDFGPGFERFVRMNFACPRSMLKESLDRIEHCVLELESSQSGEKHGDPSKRQP